MAGSAAATVSRRVNDSLRQQILDGTLEPGSRIPSERSLAEEFGVNRHAVREALKRLEQAGLIQITHGGSTRVLDWRDAGGLEVLLDLGRDSVDPPAEIVRSLLEMRASIGIDAARLCALRAEPEDRHNIARLGEKTASLVGAGDEEELDQALAIFWLAIVAGSGNIAYRLSLNSLLAAMSTFGDVAELVRPQDPAIIKSLGAAIGDAAPDAAAEVATQMLRADVERLG